MKLGNTMFSTSIKKKKLLWEISRKSKERNGSTVSESTGNKLMKYCCKKHTACHTVQKSPKDGPKDIIILPFCDSWI